MNSELKQDLSGITPEMVFEAVKAFRLDKEPREAMYDALAAASAVKSSAAQEAVAWQRKYLGATRGGRPVDWHNITREEFEQTKSGKWADKYDVRELFAAPVTAAPAVAYMIDGRTEQGLTFDKAAAETMAFANGGTVRALGFVGGTPAAPGIDLATAWAEGYRSGVTDERISESNIGIAGFGAKIEPARANPYMIDAIPKEEAKPVAYLDIGAGGYMDVGTDLSDDELQELPKGRHMLGIIGTFGIGGYVPAGSPKGGSGCRYFCGGPEGHFFCNDLKLARDLVNAYDKADEWTITDLQASDAEVQP